MPSGLTERNQRRLRCEHPKEFFFNKRAKNSLKLKRKFIRREWRYFKRNRLWDRANKAAKKLLKQQQPSSRTHRKRILMKRAMYKARIWFSHTSLVRRKEFQNHCDAVKRQQKSLQESSHVQRNHAKQHKLRHFKDMKIGTLNVRGCNQLTKRELIDDVLKQHQYDVLLLTETNVNTCSWEKWDNSVCFFSSSVDPKVREREEIRRLDGRPEGARVNYRLLPDFENAGVGIAVRTTLLPSLHDVKQINGRIISASFEAQGSPLTLICAYAPHSGHSTELKEEFYDQLSMEISQIKGRYFIGGDFNARLHYVRDYERDVCGSYIIGRGNDYLNNMSDPVKENRALFLGFCQLHGLNILNSQYSKPPDKLITYKEKIHIGENEQLNGPPFNAFKYGQIDYWLANKDGKRAVLDVQSRIDVGFDSDHFLLECRLVVTTICRKEDNSFKAKRYSKPDPMKWNAYNDKIRSLLEGKQCDLDIFTKALLEGAEAALDGEPKQKKKKFIKPQTWEKIKERNEQTRTGATKKDISDLNKEIARMARRDKQSCLIEEFNENPADVNKKGLWKAVKGLKKKFVPHYVKMKNSDGKHVPLGQRAETIADYLENIHWTNPVEHEVNTSNIIEENGALEEPFTMPELCTAIRGAKPNKQPGPDGITMELIKWLDNANRRVLLNLINTWWESKTAPSALFLARVVPIFKKGDVDIVANYRPISLLNSFYKIYMVMIRARMQEATEQVLSRTQYGFRPHRSTSHAIYILRRIQDYSEIKGAHLSIALLDWEKAFDKIQHDKLILALRRLGFSRRYTDVIADCYSTPMFFVRDNFGSSGVKKQSSGIRQGCPLSPYLFLLVMTCIDFDIQQNISGFVTNNRIPGVDFDMIYYADDTVLFSRSNRGINELLRLTEHISKGYGLGLNKNKCVAIAMNNDGSIHFDDGTPLNKEFEAIYLGNEINKTVNIHHEILNKMAEVRRTWFRLEPYWKASGASKKWKLIIYDAIIRSKLLYGLETIHLTQALSKKLDAFQMRGIRRILNRRSTFVDRSNTNKSLLDEATLTAFPSRGDRRKIIPFSKFHMQRRVKLMGHILRSNNSDPMRQISFLPDSAQRTDYGIKRVGKPRQNWLHHTKKYVYENVLGHYEYSETQVNDQKVLEAAIRRQF